MGGVFNVVKKVGGALLGTGGSKSTTTQGIAARSPEEQALQDAILKDLQSLLKNDSNVSGQAQQLAQSVVPDEMDKKIQSLFKNQVSTFLSRRQDGTVDPEALKSATSFVDQTFTAPAQQQLNQSISDFSNLQGARAAAMGRGPQDSRFQEQLFGNIVRGQTELGAQRGAAIQDMVLNQPARDIQTGLGGLEGLGAIQQQKAFAPQFLTALNSQAINNRIALLNNQGSQLDRLQRERGYNTTQTTASSGPDTGIMGSLAGLGRLGQNLTGAGGVIGLGKKLPGAIGGLLGF